MLKLPLSRKLRFYLATLAALLPGIALIIHPTQAEAVPPKIILKLDDLRTTGTELQCPEKWQRVADFLKERKIRANIGVICNSLEGDKPEYIQWIKDLNQTGLVEFWFHGYDHKDHAGADGSNLPEFEGRSYEEQKKRFDESQKLAMEKLGFHFQTFGPPGGGNANNTNLYKVVQEDPNIKVWLYPRPQDEPGAAIEVQGKVTVMDRVWQVNIEQPFFKPNLAEFQKGYVQFADRRDYFVIQGHPWHWESSDWEEFVKIVDFATQQGCEFVKAADYAAILKAAHGQ